MERSQRKGRRRVIWLGIIAGVLAVAVGVPLLIGAFTEREHREHGADLRREPRGSVGGHHRLRRWPPGVTG